MKGLCIGDNKEYLTKGKMYDIYNCEGCECEITDDYDDRMWVDADNFIFLTVSNTSDILANLIKALKELENDVLEDDLGYLNKAVDNLLIALGNLQLISHE